MTTCVVAQTRARSIHRGVCDRVVPLMNNMKIAFDMLSIHNIVCNDYATATVVLISESAITSYVLEIVKT